MAASTPPMSPGKKILRAAGSPGRYIKMKMREGSNPASVFALVVCCLGSGMLTIPYSFLENGFALGSGFVLVGAVLSIFTGYLVVYASDKTNGSCYEEIALAVFGPGWQKFTSACMIPTNGGFVLTYYVLFKSFAPHTLTLLKLELPGWCDESKVGQIFWAVLFFIVCVLATLPRKLSELRFASLLSVMLSIYVVLVIVFNAFLCKGSSESVSAGFKAGHEKTEITANGIFGSLPLILFSYMYQPNIPQIYQELENKSRGNATVILLCGTILAAVAYISAGIFGYVAFADGPADNPYTKKQLEDFFSDNALAAPYHNSKGNTPIPIFIALFGMMVVVTFAVPFCVLPMKDSIEEVRGRKFTKKDNIIWTLVINISIAIISCIFLTIKLPIAILGATTNSAIGFLLPVCYYLKLEKRTSPYTNMKIGCYIVFFFICVSSIIELVTIVIDVANGDED